MSDRHHIHGIQVRIDSLTNPEAVNPGPRSPDAAMLRSLWRVGAILEAIAVRDVATGELWLQLPNQQRLPARIASGDGQVPEEGQLLKLRVLRDSPVLAMEVMEDASTQGGAAESALRRALPQQSSPGPLLANIGWLVRHPEQLASLPQAVQQRLINFLQALPHSAQLTDAEGLQSALKDSGLFLENKLAQIADQSPTAQRLSATPELQRDLKAVLLDLRNELQRIDLPNPSHRQPPGPLPSLATAIQAIPPGPASIAALDTPEEQLTELKQQIDGTLARLQTNQLLATQSAQQGVLAWLVELPIVNNANAELVRFKFQREPSGKNDSAAAAWRVELALDLGQQGTLHAAIQWHTSQGLNIQLRSDSPSLVTRMDQQSSLLTASLAAQGLPIKTVRCLHGMPIDAHGKRLSALLDLHA